MNDPAARSNRLIHETSPYLLQHAYNPVDWYPWNEEALAKARREDKPILLSIGYSACHWCHVMAHESFEDAATARVMNDYFVNIKVDREERPDLDKIYQTALQLLTGHGGGWPLTLFLTPDDRVPFVGGTYFPREARYGMPAFTDLLHNLIAYYRSHGDAVRQQNTRLLQALQDTVPVRQPPAGASLQPQPLQDARDHLLNNFDSRYGGFGQAPKFPHPTTIEYLLRHGARTAPGSEPDRAAMPAALFTLRQMALGGIYDHLGGGFYRYAVDERWMIPHFEKMLYDNGPLLALYGDAWQMTDDPLFRTVAEATAAWVMREMQSPAGGYYSTLDADSEGEEGKFYLWTPAAVRSLLSPDEFQIFAPHYGLDRDANCEGHWHLHVSADLEAVARRAGIDRQLAATRLQSARYQLLQTRSERIWPGRDEKILCAWNALMIKGMARAARYFDRPDCVDSAERALDFIRLNLWRDGRLLAVFKDGVARLPAYLDDYAFLIDAILELLQVRWRDGDLDFALELTEVLLQHFQDTENGGFYFTADDHESLIQRPKPVYDDALPTGNGVAVQGLLRLGHLLGSERCLTAAERTLQWAWPGIERLPSAATSLLLALDDYLHPSPLVILRGPQDALEPWRRACGRVFAPGRLTLAIPNETGSLPAALAIRAPAPSPVAYVCTGPVCSAPVTTLAALAEHLLQTTPGSAGVSPASGRDARAPGLLHKIS